MTRPPRYASITFFEDIYVAREYHCCLYGSTINVRAPTIIVLLAAVGGGSAVSTKYMIGTWYVHPFRLRKCVLRVWCIVHGSSRHETFGILLIMLQYDYFCAVPGTQQ